MFKILNKKRKYFSCNFIVNFVYDISFHNFMVVEMEGECSKLEEEAWTTDCTVQQIFRKN